MMPETLTLEQARKLAKQSTSNFNPFSGGSFDDLIADANKRKYEDILKKLNLKDVKDVCIQKR